MNENPWEKYAAAPPSSSNRRDFFPWSGVPAGKILNVRVDGPCVFVGQDPGDMHGQHSLMEFDGTLVNANTQTPYRFAVSGIRLMYALANARPQPAPGVMLELVPTGEGRERTWKATSRHATA